MIKNSIRNPLGSLAQYKSFGDEPADVENMYKILMVYWSAVKKYSQMHGDYHLQKVD